MKTKHIVWTLAIVLALIGLYLTRNEPTITQVDREQTLTLTNKVVQCKGITKDSIQCKRKTAEPNGYCWQHQSQSLTLN